MNKLSTTLLTFLLAVSLQLPTLSQATSIQRKSYRQGEKRYAKADNQKSAMSSRFDCLPAESKLNDVVSYRPRKEGSDDYITIEDRLIEMKARCKQGRLVDSKGREVKFFKFSCYGNPPLDYEEIAQKERDELDKLQKDFTVIVMECDPRAN